MSQPPLCFSPELTMKASICSSMASSSSSSVLISSSSSSFSSSSALISSSSSSSSTSTSTSSSSASSSSSSYSRHDFFHPFLRCLRSWRCFSDDDVRSRITELTLLHGEPELQSLEPHRGRFRVSGKGKEERGAENEASSRVLFDGEDSGRATIRVRDMMMMDESKSKSKNKNKNEKIRNRVMKKEETNNNNNNNNNNNYNNVIRVREVMKEATNVIRVREEMKEATNVIRVREEMKEATNVIRVREVMKGATNKGKIRVKDLMREGKEKEKEEEEEEESNEIRVMRELMGASVTKVKLTYEPIEEFYVSMVDMVMDMGLTHLKDMEDMLACYVALNSPIHHPHIQVAYTSLISHLLHMPI